MGFVQRLLVFLLETKVQGPPSPSFVVVCFGFRLVFFFVLVHVRPSFFCYFVIQD